VPVLAGALDPIGLPSSVMLETTTISGLPGTLQRSPKMLKSMSPKRRVKATCCCGVILWPRQKMTPCSSKARSISAKILSPSGRDRSTPRISAPTAAPVGMTSNLSSDIAPFLLVAGNSRLARALNPSPAGAGVGCFRVAARAAAAYINEKTGGQRADG